jgi:hypothetical protein
MEFKLTFLFNWVEKLVLNLKENNITVSKPHPTILVSAMANVMEWLGPVLTSMVGNPESITPKSEIEFLTSESLGGSNQSKLDSKTYVISESSDGDGSVSEEERSDEGSQSEDEDAGNEYDMGSSSHDESVKAIVSFLQFLFCCSQKLRILNLSRSIPKKQNQKSQTVWIQMSLRIQMSLNFTDPILSYQWSILLNCL